MNPLNEQLDRLAENPSDLQKESNTITGRVDNIKYEIEAEQADKLGVTIRRLRLSRDSDQSSHFRSGDLSRADRVRTRLVRSSSPAEKRSASDSPADRFCEQVTYLGDAMSIVEQDTESRESVIRSNPPARRREVFDYFEARVRPDAIELERFAARVGQPREAKAVTLTRETLRRLIQDGSKIISR